MNNETLALVQDFLVTLRKYVAKPDISFSNEVDSSVIPYSTGRIPEQEKRYVTDSKRKLVLGQKHDEKEKHQPVSSPGVDATNLHRQDEAYLEIRSTPRDL